MNPEDSLEQLSVATQALDDVYNEQFYYHHSISMRALEISIEVKRLIAVIRKQSQTDNN